MVFQSKDGVTSEIDGWFRRSFMSAAVRAAIGSVGSGAAMAGCNQRRVFWGPLKETVPSEGCNVVWFHNHCVDFQWKFDTILPEALGMCWEHSECQFWPPGMPLHHDMTVGTTYGTTRGVYNVCGQSFKAVASIVWVGEQKYQFPWSSLCMLRLEHTHRGKQHSTVSQTFSLFLWRSCFHFLSSSKTKKSPLRTAPFSLNMRLDFLKISFVSLPRMKYYDGTMMCWYYMTFIGSHIMSMKQPWSWGGIQQEHERALLCAMYFNARCHNIFMF